MKIARFLLTFIFFVPVLAFAQGLPGVSNPVSIIMSPTNPAPGDTVTLTAESSSFDVNSALLVWKVNGAITSHGTGDKTISVFAGVLGKKTVIDLSAQVSGLGTFSDSITINPGTVDLIWEANTSVPPFYEGKALLGWGATFKVVAVPEISENGSIISPSNLVYTWSKNYSVDANQSGYGKNVYSDDGSINYTQGGDIIGVKIATKDGEASSQGSTTVSPVTPSLLLYEESPIYGILYNESLSQTTLSGDSVTLRAEPFFFSNISSIIGSLAWSMNGSAVPDFAGKQSLTLVRQDKNAGTSQIIASLQSQIATLQGAQGSVTININAEK